MITFVKVNEVPVGSLTVIRGTDMTKGIKIIYGSRIWISIVFKILGKFLFEGGQDYPPGPMTYISFTAL